MEATKTAGAKPVGMKLEVVLIGVSDVDLSKAFYEKLGWRMDGDFPVGNNFRAVQMTPTHSNTSIIFGRGITSAQPGALKGLVLAVDDIDNARNDLIARGVEVSETFHFAGGPLNDAVKDPRIEGRDPENRSYFSFASFEDPDGNEWLMQGITARFPGRVESPLTSFGSVPDLASALRRAETAHGEHEKVTGQRDENWPEWYAAYMVSEQAGTEPPK
jgi:catechol 2,3-dioxygenase-like lactoylglutathione lyase family enzyme